MAVLKPCPFCGSKWTQVRWIGFEDSPPCGFASGYRAECTDCGAMTLPALSVEAAAEVWDMRAKDVRPVKEGYWVKARGSWCTPGGDPVWECSECGKGVHVYGIEHGTYGSDIADGQWVSCPNCGAMMGGTP